MRLRPALTAVALVGTALVSIPLISSPASATTVLRGCVESDSYSFSPPLGAVIVTGSYGFDFNRTCVAADVTTSPVKASVGQEPPLAGGSGGSYFGDCAFALLTGSTVGIIVGGAVEINVLGSGTTSDLAKVQALVPNSPCNVSTASGAGAKFDTV